MSSGGTGEFDPHGRELEDAFFGGQAAGQRAHLALQAEDRAARDQIAEATGVADAALLAELAGLGIRVETLSALTLIPLVEVAWADGEIDDAERHAILAGAVSTGVEPGSSSYQLLEIWTLEKPPPDMRDLWKSFTRVLCAELSEAESSRLERNVLGRARAVAAAAGDSRDASPHVSVIEEGCLEDLARAFR
jgi:hypothetical protein